MYLKKGEASLNSNVMGLGATLMTIYQITRRHVSEKYNTNIYYNICLVDLSIVNKRATLKWTYLVNSIEKDRCG
jgi:hypothetical protein